MEKIEQMERDGYTLTDAGRKYVDEFKERIKAGNDAKKRAKNGKHVHHLANNSSPTSVGHPISTTAV